MRGSIVDGRIDGYFLRLVVVLVDVADEKIIILVPLMLVQLTHNLLLFGLFHLLFLHLLQMQLLKALLDLLVGQPCLALFFEKYMDKVELSHCYPITYHLK